MVLKCVAIDDEPLALELIKNYVSRFPSLQLLQTFEDAVSGAEYLRNNPVDLLFVDINMPDITGIDLVRSLESKPMVIFTTAYKNFAFEGFELEAIDYLLKPIDVKRFGKAIEKAADYLRYKTATTVQGEDENLYVYSEYRMVKIALKDIEYIESMEDYIKIHLQFDKTVLTLMPLKKVLEKLPEDKFQRIHRSYIVPVSKIISIQNRKVKLPAIELPISDSYANFARRWMKLR
ncbi:MULTISPECIES: LytTR family DNA-binding domain-containing protein [unclassified Mucilaginibacter]|uniref:LytR/AlgR family response regulator transcription factor n=1 Tax=unclassified Mucilaginibacter TaxID=2617802 RepID=UPI002AC9CD32|nr:MULTISPECIES: LytTR family DNA-binding domain-containing protein [unclassified Mucilaginibacter]MEB0263750.1 LytTR family DNA-binding domain-containing protein [Mucilaginibacter sp. 10I4]MEB0278556.1 LytTR family DNA-binding domain-containing protein [Mucilaginibacter sp. 10B2]MEB0299267.1 LytTR family DNA-binding domain-containing protein [Mucilaginibacter sp. 5C4]WPX23487.1 LytTR family DNA-binding domain-containing protein [Mucilaginibacter sp. 5C4]